MEWFTLYILDELNKAEKQMSKNLMSGSLIPDKLSDWLDRHKVIDALFPWIVSLVVGLLPFVIVFLIMKFYLH